jgi:hypothetical protein
VRIPNRFFTNVRRAALPYGYTVVTWTTGGVLIHHHGPPDLLQAYLFLLGAGLGLGLIALAAGTDTDRDPGPAHRSVIGSVLAAGVALGAGGVLAGAISGQVAYFAVAFAATLAYFVTRALAGALL